MTNVLMTGVIVLRDVNTALLIVTIITNVPKMTAKQILDAPTPRLNVMTMTLVPLILAVLSEDVNMRK
jgi:hypothetical protein